jgi:hypothetical protein
MKLWQHWFNDKSQRERWEAGLRWFRLRYLDPAGPVRALTLLSRPRAAGRIALYFQPTADVSRLHVGLPEPYAATLKQMAADFAFSLQPADPTLALPPPQPLAPAEALPWERPFVAHVVDGRALSNTLDEGAVKGPYLPAPPADNHEHLRWHLPDEPPTGLRLQPFWNGQGPPAHLLVPADEAHHWPLGQARDGRLLQAPGRINVYGDGGAVAEWLVHVVLRALSMDPAGLIVVDGAGDLVPRLKRKQQVTRLLGRRLTYIDIDGAAVAGGFNPLALLPGETEVERRERWQRWFASMDVHPESLPLLSQAMAERVGDVPSLQRWLERPEQQQQTSTASLNLALKRLLADALAREWLTWPTDCFANLREAALFFACRAQGRTGSALLQSILLAAGHGDHVVAYGIPWKEVSMDGLRDHPRLIIGNGPLLSGSTVILTHTLGPAAATLAGRFLAHDVQQEENMQLLKSGEAIIAFDGSAVPISWHAAP